MHYSKGGLGNRPTSMHFKLLYTKTEESMSIINQQFSASLELIKYGSRPFPSSQLRNFVLITPPTPIFVFHRNTSHSCFNSRCDAIFSRIHSCADIRRRHHPLTTRLRRFRDISSAEKADSFFLTETTFPTITFS